MHSFGPLSVIRQLYVRYVYDILQLMLRSQPHEGLQYDPPVRAKRYGLHYPLPPTPSHAAVTCFSSPASSQHLAQGLIQNLFSAGHSVPFLHVGDETVHQELGDVAPRLKVDDLRPAPQQPYFISTGFRNEEELI